MSIGGAYLSWGLILFGRTLIGISVMVSIVCVSVITGKWFMNKNLNLAYALMASSWGTASMISSIISPILYGTVKDPHLGTAFFASFWFSIIGIAFLIPVLVIDKMSDD